MPSQANLFHVNEEADVENYYRPLVGYMYRKRLEMGLQMLEANRYGKALEIGYGSGVSFKTLNSFCDDLYGVDLHPNMAKVEESGRREGFHANLRQGDILDLPYPDSTFDLVLCFSTMEHIRETDRAIGQITRVLKPTGTAIVGFPTVGKLMDVLFRAIGFDEVEEHHVSDHRKILASCSKLMRVEGVRRLPPFVPLSAALYVVCKCRTH